MNFSDIQTLWQSPHNQPTPAQLETMKTQFLTELRRQRRTFHIWIGIVLFWLVLLTALAGWHTVFRAKSGESILAEWGATVLLVMTWAAAAGFLIQHRRTRTAGPSLERSTTELIRALLDENRLARIRLKTIAVLDLAMLALVPVIVTQLRAAGKAGDEILIPAFVLLPAGIALVLAVMIRTYRRRLLPRQRRLEALLDSCTKAND